MRKKSRKKRQPRTPEEIALTARTAGEAQQKGIDVHREYIKNLLENMNPDEKKLVFAILAQVGQVTDEENAKEIFKKISQAKTVEDFKNILGAIND